MSVRAWPDNLDSRAEAINAWMVHELTEDNQRNSIPPETVKAVVGEISWLCRVVGDGGSDDPRRLLVTEYLSCLGGLLRLPGEGAPNV